MQFVVDESTGDSVAEYLRSSGYDVLVVAETMPQADDVDILTRATAEGRIVVTNDKDLVSLSFAVGRPIRVSYFSGCVTKVQPTASG